MRVSKEQMMEIHVSPIQGLLSVLTSMPYQYETVWDAMKARLGEKMSSSSLSYKDISILDASVIQMAVSTVSNSLPLPTESFLVCRSLINRHPWLSEKYDEEWLIPALLQPTLQNRKATL